MRITGTVRLLFAACCLTLAACEPPLPVNKYRENNFYPNDSRLNVAYLVIEWAEKKPMVMASGFLASKEKGIFYTAKHFTDVFGRFGPDYCKVFFNGKVYEARVMKVPPLSDAALIRITSSFSQDDLGEPLLFAAEASEYGDTLYVQGLHPHKYLIRQLNAKDGFPDKAIDIFETYYGQKIKDPAKETQIVFDNLKGTVVMPDPESVRSNKLLPEDVRKATLEYENDSYIKIITERDHRFSFGGLSGGAAINAKGELVGVITAQDPMKFEFDSDGFFFDPDSKEFSLGISKQIFDTIYITPMRAIRDLNKFVEEAR